MAGCHDVKPRCVTGMARNSLNAGTRIDAYAVGSVLSQDEAGISYLGEFGPDESDARSVCIREFFPQNLSQRRKVRIYAPRRASIEAFEEAVSARSDVFARYLGLRAPGLAGGLARFEENGTVYLVSEWPTGESLYRQSVRDGLFSPGYTRSLLEGMLPAMRALEKSGLVHGNITPAHLMRTKDGAPVIVNPVLVETDTKAAPLDLPEDIAFPYQAAELQDPDAGTISSRSDIYALAASFYFLITGQIPVSGSVRRQAVSEGRDDPLDLARLEEQLHDDGVLYEALEAALAPEPSARFATVAAFEKALHLAAGVVPPSAGTLLPGKQSWWSRYGRTSVAAGTVICLLLVSIPLLDAMQSGPAQPDGSVLTETDGRKRAAEEANEPLVDAPAEPEAVPETREPAEEVIPASVMAWKAVDQSSPAAVSEFYQTYADDADVNVDVRERWVQLDNAAWQVAGDTDTVPAYQTYLATFDTGLRLNGAYLSDARERVTALEEADQKAAEDAAAKAEAEAKAALGDRPGDVIRDCETCPDLVVLTPEAGRKPDLAILRTEVTIGEFRTFVAATGRRMTPGCIVSQSGSASPWTYGGGNSFQDPGYAVNDKSPVSCVSFDDASAYGDWLSQKTGETYRLASRAEWLSAGSQTSRRPTEANACSLANLADASLSGQLQNVQASNCSDAHAFAAPATGGKSVQAMYGNIAEWVSDCVDGNCGSHLAMGGSWASGPGIIRAGLQETYTSNSRNSALGFRLVREID